MKINKVLFVMSCSIFLMACSEETTNNPSKDKDNIDKGEVETVPPIVPPELDGQNPPSEPLTPTVRPMPDTITPSADINYLIPNSNISSVVSIEREYTEAFSLDEITVRHTEGLNNYEVINATPRYLSQPTLKINDLLFKLDTILEPFQKQTFNFNFDTHVDKVRFVEFVEEQPFFRMHMNEYKDKPSDDLYGIPSEYNAFQYEQEMRAYKNALNDLSFNLHFADYISNYRTKRAEPVFIERMDCPHDHTHFKTGYDTSNPNRKIISMLTFEPSSEHRLLMHSYYGYATMASGGFLSVRDYRLYQEGQTIPKTTYLHEKLHNHSFGHDGGMTYGLPDVLVSYMSDGDKFPHYFEHKKVAHIIPRATVQTEAVIDGDYLNVKLSFYSNNTNTMDLRSIINRFMLVWPDKVEMENISTSVIVRGQEHKLTPDVSYASGRILIFQDNFEVPITHLSQQTNNHENYISIRLPMSEANNSSFVFMGSNDPDSWSVQANAKVEISAKNQGLITGKGQFVFYNTEKIANDLGKYEEIIVEYTPAQAEQLCIDKGFSGLGVLKKYKSTDQMDFQYEYLEYESQVGIDPDTLQPVAVSIPTSYRPNLVEYADVGKLIVCQ
ncbi:hypothetical protein [Vibrio crassostreae]|uniref:hypothetical protein n=1 Tax=Vibrio crassostreae TaxID=246167 RepID=UPI004067F5D2